MPLPSGTRYRYKNDTHIRLAFAKGTNRVIEAKNIKTGDTSTNWNDLHSVAKRLGKKRKK